MWLVFKCSQKDLYYWSKVTWGWTFYCLVARVIIYTVQSKFTVLYFRLALWTLSCLHKSDCPRFKLVFLSWHCGSSDKIWSLVLNIIICTSAKHMQNSSIVVYWCCIHYSQDHLPHCYKGILLHWSQCALMCFWLTSDKNLAFNLFSFNWLHQIRGKAISHPVFSSLCIPFMIGCNANALSEEQMTAGGCFLLQKQ